MTNNQFAMVSEWMADGNINEFIKYYIYFLDILASLSDL